MRSELPEALQQDLARRWRVCRSLSAERGCDGLLVVGRTDRPGDLYYLAGHRPGMGGHVSRGRIRGRGFGALFLPVDAPLVLMTTTAFFEGIPFVQDVRTDSDLPQLIGDTLHSLHADGGTIALVGEDVLTLLLHRELLQHLPRVRWVPADDLVMNLRSQKSPYEIACLRRGAAIADQVGEKVRALIKPGLTELDISACIVEELTRMGVTRALATCQSGVQRSGEPIAYPLASSRVIEAGDMLHMEINGAYDGYLIDICRSTVAGRANREQRRLLGVALEMLETTIGAIRPGVRAAELGAVAGRIAQREGLGRSFTLEYGGPGTYVGHAIGVGVDEPPVLGLDDPTPLAAGMVLTIEPGLYRTPVGGCRIEDEVLVTGEGAEVLTALERVWWG